MTEKTKQRLRERFEQILAAQDKSPQTMHDIEAIARKIRDAVAQATLEEVSQEAQEAQERGEQPEQGEVSPAPQGPALSNPSKVACRHCRGNAWFKGVRSRCVVSLMGEVCLMRRYYYCRRCDTGFCPLDAVLHLPDDTAFTLPLQQEVACLSAALPFAQAVQVLARLTGARLSARSAQRLCIAQAHTQVEDFVGQRQETLLPLAYAPPDLLPSDLPAPPVLYIEADGVQTPMQGGSWREMKVGVVRSTFLDGREDQPSRYISHLGEAAPFGRHWEALALGAGSLKAKQVVVLGDGAPWLWNLAQERFPLAGQILDFFHACQYVGQVAREVFGEGTMPARTWLLARVQQMTTSQWTAFHREIEAVRSVATEAVSDLVRYFANNASCMDYATYLKAGWCIGSGLAESSCKRLVSQRLKGSGMHWSERGAQVICRLRGFLLGGEWDTFTAFWTRSWNRSPRQQRPCQHLALSPRF